MTPSRFSPVFGPKPLIGMLHLAGGEDCSSYEKKFSRKLTRVMEELAIYEEEGLQGALFENYHGSVSDVHTALMALKGIRSSLQLGVNILPNQMGLAMQLAHEYGLSFVQVDYVAGRYARAPSDEAYYHDLSRWREEFPHIFVLGGVWPKYYTPLPGSILEEELKEGMQRADAIVVTGTGTGMETPLEKIRQFRQVLGDDYPLVVGAGLTAKNVKGQMGVADGGIVGSAFKIGGQTWEPVERDLVRAFVAAKKG